MDVKECNNSTFNLFFSHFALNHYITKNKKAVSRFKSTAWLFEKDVKMV